MKKKKPGRNSLITLIAHLALACVGLTLCQFEGALGVHRIALPQHPTFISRHYRDTSQDVVDDTNVDSEVSLLQSLLEYVAEQRKHPAIVSPSDSEDCRIAALVRDKVKRALAEEDYKTLYFNRVRDDLARTLGEKKIGAISDISEHLRKNYKDEARRREKIVKREVLNENYYKTLYIQKIADDIKADLSKTNTRNIPISKLNEIVKRELEDNFKSQYIAKVTSIVKGQLEKDLKQVAKRDARWNAANSEWIRKEAELLYKLETYQGRDKRQVARADLPADFKTLYIQRIADDVKREVVGRNMTNVSVNKLNEIVKRELESNLKSDYIAKLTAFLKGQLEHTLQNITPEISRKRRQALYVDPNFFDCLDRVQRDLAPPAVDDILSGDAIAKIIQAFMSGQFTSRVDDTKTEALNPKSNADEDSADDAAIGGKTETGSANPYLPAVRYHDPRDKAHHVVVQDKEGRDSDERQRGQDKDKGVIIDGVPENEYFKIEPFDKEAIKKSSKGEEEDAKDDPPYALNYYKRDHCKEHAGSDSCDNAPKKPACPSGKDGSAKQPKKGKYCKVKVSECGAPCAHRKPGGEGCSSTRATTTCSTTTACTTTHRPGGKKCGGKSPTAPAKTKPKCPPGKAANASEPVITGDIVHFEIFSVNVPTPSPNASSSPSTGGKCGRRSSDGAPFAKHGVSLAKGNRHPVEKVPVKVNYKGEKLAEKKSWHRRHSAEAKSAGEDEVGDDDGKRSKRRKASEAEASRDEDEDRPLMFGRRRLLSFSEEEDLDVDWVKALAPHLSIRKRDLSTDPLNGYPADEDAGRPRVKRTADGFGDDDDVRRNCFDDEVEVAKTRMGNDGQRNEPSDETGSEEREDGGGVQRRETDGGSLADGQRYFEEVAEQADEDEEGGNWEAEQGSSFNEPRETESSGGADSDSSRVREKRNSDGSLCVLLKANIKEDDHGDNETRLTINGKADYKLSVKNEGKEGVGNEATNLTMNGAANLNQEFVMPKQCPGEAMREISAELVEKLNSLGNCGGAERLMAPQDGGRRVGRVVTTGSEGKRGVATSASEKKPGVTASENKPGSAPSVAADASGSRRVGRVVDGGTGLETKTAGASGGVPEEKSVEKDPKPRDAAVETKLTENAAGKIGVVRNVPVYKSPQVGSETLAVETAKAAPVADNTGVCQGVVGVRNDPAKKEMKLDSKVTRRSNSDLYQIGLGKLLVAARRNKVAVRDAGATDADVGDVGQPFSRVESALGMTNVQESLEPHAVNVLEVPKDKAGDFAHVAEEVNSGDGRLPEKRSVGQEDNSRIRDLMDSFGGGNHKDDEIGKRDLINDLYESFGPVDADVDEVHVKKDLGPGALASADVCGDDVEDKIAKRSVNTGHGGGQPRSASPRQRRWHPGYRTERYSVDNRDDGRGDGDHASRVQEMVCARRARGRPSWNSLGLDIAGYVRDKRMTFWAARTDEFQHMLRDIVQSHHDGRVAGFDGHGHYFNPMHFAKSVPDRRKRNYRAHARRQLQPEEEDEMIDADGQACGGRRQECDEQDGVPRTRPEKMSTDEPDDPGDCDEATEEGAEASVGASRAEAGLIGYAVLVTVGRLLAL